MPISTQQKNVTKDLPNDSLINMLGSKVRLKKIL